MEVKTIRATTLSDAWYQGIFQCVESGRKFKIDKGSFEGQYRCEFDYITIHIKYPGTLPLLPKIRAGMGIPDPVDENYLDDYLPYLMTGEEKEGESYTYGQRICKAPADYVFGLMEQHGIVIDVNKIPEFSATDAPIIWEEDGVKYVNQMELMIWTYQHYGHRNNQMIMQVGQPNDMMLLDPPCLRHIDTRIQDGQLHFIPYFRSWDLFGGFPANLAAIELMKQYCAEMIGVDNGEIIASSKGLHIYDYTFEIAEAIRGRNMDEFQRHLSK